MIGDWVEIEFECLPLRSVTRLDVPVDASPAYEQFVLRVKASIAKHGSYNSYFLHRGRCRFFLTNDSDQGSLEFRFEGVALTDADDLRTRAVDLDAELTGETCSWLTTPVVDFFAESVRHAVVVDFDRYIRAGDLKKAEERIRVIQEASESGGGFLGMYL